MKPRILIVDDLKDILTTLSRYFAGYGFDVDCATEREEAEALIGINKYVMVITDLHLTPVRSNDGLEIVRLLRHESPETKIIMLTAYANEEVEKEASRYGIACFLKKPVSLSVLRQAVIANLGR